MSPSRFWGREPSWRLERDEAGWRIDREPEFDDMDRAMIVAYRAIEAETTENGFKRWEESTPLADPDNPEATHEFIALEPQINFANRARERAHRQWREAYKESPDQLDGVFIPVVKRDLTAVE
ncbi:hypothetical protein GCM10011490_24260 [Pseudoclavibacter endophyticus]|uniref:Uncharacterized protein n=1 Tax=Pseudoclavibacter endophyticus TaxID=1778590 RepID=A0A6H9WIS3_9MICO|nr:hypothetical protein [Pseudoclavibacter endophyticus]KAB1648427.1 hypothetical protein F8O04_12135 [Pseudoclavibacter endophyticus]GGA72634.1 hypothetical protein GCM10011490_24260 [Pseudoclavibacter endophyticus]